MENGRQRFIPVVIAYKFFSLQPDSEIVYKCSDYYAREIEGAMRRDDPVIGIDCPLSGQAVLSEKDAEAPLDGHFTWEGTA